MFRSAKVCTSSVSGEEAALNPCGHRPSKERTCFSGSTVTLLWQSLAAYAKMTLSPTRSMLCARWLQWHGTLGDRGLCIV